MHLEWSTVCINTGTNVIVGYVCKDSPCWKRMSCYVNNVTCVVCDKTDGSKKEKTRKEQHMNRTSKFWNSKWNLLL